MCDYNERCEPPAAMIFGCAQDQAAVAGRRGKGAAGEMVATDSLASDVRGLYSLGRKDYCPRDEKRNWS